MNNSSPNRTLRILLAYDGSEHAKAAIHLLRDLPLSQGSQVTVLGVLIPRESSSHDLLEDALDQAYKLLTEKGFDARIEMLLGYPAEQIIKTSEEQQPDLIVIGAKGLRATLGILLGGVAQQVVEYSNQPVLVVRAPYTGLKRALLVVDGSLSSRNAMEYLAGTVQTPGAIPGEIHCQRFPLPVNIEMNVMHVLPPIPSAEIITPSWPIGPDVLPPIPLDRSAEADWLKEEEEQGKHLLDQVVGFLSRCSGTHIAPILGRGDAATEIIQYTRENQVDLIIAGSRGLSEMQSWLLGSVSRKLVHYAGCSVLIVKNRPPAE